MTLSALLALAVRLHPAFAHGLPARAEPRLAVILDVTPDAREQVELMAMDFVETTFRERDSHGRRITPFGAQELDRVHPGRHTLEEYAMAALETLRMATRECGDDLARRMHFFRLGRCGPVDREARRRARIVRRVVAGFRPP